MPDTQPAPQGSLLGEIMEQTNLTPGDEGYEVARKGVEAFIAQLLTVGRTDAKADKSAVDAMIAEIDRKLSRQLDAILHAEAFQRLESSWRSLKMLVDRTDFRENVRIELFNVSKDDLQADFEDAPTSPRAASTSGPIPPSMGSSVANPTPP